MTRITRKQAESLLNESSVMESKVYQNNDLIRVTLKLSDDSSLIYKFDIKNKTKTYFIENPHHYFV